MKIHWLVIWWYFFPFIFFCNAQSNKNITIKPPIYQTDVIVIPFNIPNAGMVEFYLFDDINNKGILRTQLICEKGDSMITFSRKKIEEGMPYRYEVIYKGQKVLGKLRP
jgi:hypothetical protein